MGLSEKDMGYGKVTVTRMNLAGAGAAGTQAITRWVVRPVLSMLSFTPTELQVPMPEDHSTVYFTSVAVKALL